MKSGDNWWEKCGELDKGGESEKGGGTEKGGEQERLKVGVDGAGKWEKREGVR